MLQLAATRYEDVAFYGVLYSDEPVKAKAYLKRAGAAYPTEIDGHARTPVAGVLRVVGADDLRVAADGGASAAAERGRA